MKWQILCEHFNQARSAGHVRWAFVFASLVSVANKWSPLQLDLRLTVGFRGGLLVSPPPLFRRLVALFTRFLLISALACLNVTVRPRLVTGDGYRPFLYVHAAYRERDKPLAICGSMIVYAGLLHSLLSVAPNRTKLLPRS